ncbi:unnamed protein product [Trifolium pratense]|uniref:Uncharacterized protein n=1 Tax=Trifolium pratense TaxID=57577 RepID=A0ACB0MC07_TRIPR|nr:unnamed protein product [Trifolium pratense]
MFLSLLCATASKFNAPSFISHLFKTLYYDSFIHSLVPQLKNKTQIQTKKLRKLMSAIVEIWVGELTKLREKVLTINPLLSKTKQGSTDQNNNNNNKESVSVPPRNNNSSSSTMSEATVCLLMDRFVPW